ncbi:MAG TPA: FkbM family methyltransferase [Chitinophagaceae bacterium]|nr:FkbM family methyltransferase [Chitinophagaceae bacterium]
MLKRFFYHLRKGTLLNAIRYKIEMYRWRKFSKDKQFFFLDLEENIKLKLYTDSMFSRAVWLGGFEEAEIVFMRRFIKPNDKVIDVGANIGVHTLIASKLSGNKGSVFACEPVEYIYKRLKENIDMNSASNVQMINKAISDKTGASEITISLDGFDAWNSLGGESNNTGHHFRKETIETITLDDFINGRGLSIRDIGFIKIDTEGWEFNVLKGSTVLMSEDAPVLMLEYSEEISKNFGFSIVMIFDKLTQYGYSVYDYNYNNNSLKLLKRGEDSHLYNVIAAKRKEDISKRIKDITFLQ